jgi:AraC family transcriptional activator of pobA
MKQQKEILTIENMCKYEHQINLDPAPCDLNLMIMPGTLEDKHKNIDPAKGVPALRRHFNLIFIFTGGKQDVQMGAEYQWLKPNDLVIVPENMVFASPHILQCTGYCTHFTTEFVQPLLSGSLSEDFSFFSLEAEHIISLTPEQSEIIQQSFRDIIAEHKRFSSEKNFVLRNYMHILLLRAREIYKTHAKIQSEQATRPVQLAHRFKHLVEKNFIEKRTVKEYADMMNVSTSHLSDVVSETLGRSPIKLIQDMLLLEAKVLLRSTSLTGSEIAHELQFNDQSHFSHFIKSRTGFSPQELRKTL